MTKSLVATLALLAAACAAAPKAKAPADPRLFAEIAALDRAMFDAFNAHDAAKLEPLFSPDLEFFHDKGGLQKRDQIISGLRGNFERNDGLRRRLIPGSLEVYPIPGYGAIETGTHEFCHEENGKTDCGVFRFLHVWQNQNGRWQVTRVVSYDH
jgi:hypothetical protein